MAQSAQPARNKIYALVIGPGGVASSVIDQLAKNSRFNVVWAAKEINTSDFFDDHSESSEVVRTIELEKSPSPLILNDLIEEYQPDIVFLCQRGSDWEMEDMVASSNLERAMLGESVIIGEAPIITVSLEQQTEHKNPGQ